MTDSPSSFASIYQAWKADLHPAACDRCGWLFLVSRAKAQAQCPHCHQAGLTEITSMPSDMLRPYPPELVIPFQIAQPHLEASISRFSAGIPYPPEGLNYGFLKSHLQPVYLPVWLVDAHVQATWSAETGFDYDVMSHQETYDQDGSGWTTREIKETRVRWENRVGRMDRPYQNVTAQAMDDATQILPGLGEYQKKSAQPYDSSCLAAAFVRVPDHTPDEAWNEAVQSFANAASEDCRQACEADRLRQFRWKAVFQQINWTMMLLPAYTSFYYDDSGKPQPILINGQTGQLAGARRASTRRAWGTSLVLLLVGIILFLIGIIVDTFAAGSMVLGGLAMMLILLGVTSGLGSFYPIITVLDFNRKQNPK